MDSNSKEFYGIIDIVSINNFHIDEVSKPGFINMEDKHLKFVHYPDCQQLIIWLPQTGRDYTTMLLLNKANNISLIEAPVSALLNGEIQILIDTLSFPPALYSVVFTHKSGSQHIISFIKYEAGFKLPKKERAIEQANMKPAHEKEPIIYRDGFGNILENEDLNMAKRLKQEIFNKFNRRVEYDGNLRAGTITYVDGNTRIKFDHEMGSGNCLFFIFIPTEKEWEKATGTTLSQRDEILKFVAEAVQREKASSTRFEVTSSEITYYH